jgi:TatD DNase family protein
MKLIDTHAHLDFPQFSKDREEVIARSQKQLKYIINVGADLASSHRSLELSLNYNKIFSTVGIHPHDATDLDQKSLIVMKDLAKADKVVGIGETGLDFHYDNSPRNIQKQAFQKQIDLAQEINLPLVIHSREADEETMSMLEKNNVENGIWHCFSSNKEIARKVLDLGLYIAFGGIITFKNAENIRDLIKSLPLDRLLIETDSPFLTPVPHRGQRNQPAYVEYVVKKIAEIKETSLEEVAEKTTKNAERVYRLPGG